MLDELLENAVNILADEEPCFAMCVPYFISNDCINNDQMRDICGRFGTVDRRLAIAQFRSIVREVSATARIYFVPSLPGLQDQVYVSNVAATFGRGTSRPLAVLAEFKGEGRAGEEKAARLFFASHGYDVLASPYDFEGEADLKEIGPGLYVGAFGSRTSLDALKWLESAVEIEIVRCPISDPRLYHLDCVLFRWGERRVAAVTSVLDPGFLKRLELCVDVIDVPLEVGLAGATNCLHLGNRVLCDDNSALFARDTDLLERERAKRRFLEQVADKIGLSITMVPMTEFIKSGAALSCMFLRMNQQRFVS